MPLVWLNPVWGGGAAEATTLKLLSLDEQLADGGVAVEVTVGASAAEDVILDGARWTVTYYTLRVDAIVAGRAETEVVRLLLPGGEGADGVVTTWPGTPVFAVGDRALLVGRADNEGTLRLSNFYRSVFRPVTDDVGAVVAGTDRGVVLAPVGCGDHGFRRALTDAEAAGRGALGVGVPWRTFLAGVGRCTTVVTP